MGIVQRVDRFQRAHPSLGFPIAVLYKFFDDSGIYLAALIAYYAFISLFPLLLLATTILGYALSGNPHLQHQLLDSALSDFPVVGDQLRAPQRIGGGVGGLTVGIVGAIFGGLGVSQASQYAMNTAWNVPRNDRPNPFKARGRSLLLLTVVGGGVLATAALSTIGNGDAISLGTFSKVLVLAGSVVLTTIVFVFAFRIATAQDLSIRDVAPGAIAAAIVWQLLQTFGVTYVDHVVRHASSTNGVFALVLGLLAFLYLAAIFVMLCVEINVVRVQRLHPRALLTPFTDNVSLTSGDERSYTGQAKAQRSKGFETIDVAFTPRAAPRPLPHRPRPTPDQPDPRRSAPSRPAPS